MRGKKESQKDREVFGEVIYSDSGEPAGGLSVTVWDADLMVDDELGRAETDPQGKFRITYGIKDFRDHFERAPDIYLMVKDAQGNVITSTRDAVVREAGPRQEIRVQIAGRGPRVSPPRQEVGGAGVDPLVFRRLEPRTLLDAARFAIRGRGDEKAAEVLRRLSPELSLETLREQFCFTPLVRFLRDAVRVKRWPREIALELEDILIGFDADASYASFDCPNFVITYQTSGFDAVPSADTGGNITMPGTGAVVGATTGGNGVPDYVEKLCFWLENALATYTNPPFSLRNPAAGGKIPVNVTGTSAGSAGGGSMTIGRNLNDDLLAAVPTHELMHLIQELYESNGTAGGWNPGMVEGGAVLGEDVVFDTHNRYVVQATSAGTLNAPQVSLNSSSARYYLALYLKYISEQQSARINPADEPAIGVETYRALLERFDASGYGDAAFATAVAELPWYQAFTSFGYLDPARLDETSSETLLGNFWLACYLKDFGMGVPDRRFEFMEDEENATWDSIFTGMDTVGTLGPVALASTSTLGTSGTLTLSSGSGGSVSPFAARFFRVNVDAAVDTLRLAFNAGAGFTRPLVQVLLVEPGNLVRDVLRTDRTTWSRTVASLRGGTRLDHVVVVVAGTETGGTFSLTAQSVAATPDVMVSRWHHQAGRHYEIDPFGWAWTWVSPDIWVDNNGNGMADSEVFFNQNNQLFIRLRNQGLAAASGIGVDFWYQDASAGLSDAGWLPVQDTGGITQSLSGLSLAAGATNQWSVDWAPVPSGASNHFCIRAVVTVPGDPNTDNKRVLSNFGNVIAGSPYLDLSLLRRLPGEMERFRIDVIPRAGGRWFVSLDDVRRAERAARESREEAVDLFRIRRRKELTRVEGHPHTDERFLARRACHLHDQTPEVRRPDPLGHYPTDPRALPPGLEGVPLITVSHVVDGRPIGGFTWAIREEKR